MPYAPRATLDNPYGPAITFRTEDVLPPTAYYVSPDDSVASWILTNQAGLTVNFEVRLLTPTGELKLLPYSYTPTQYNTWYPAFIVPPVEGYILGAQSWADNPQRGQCWTSLMVMRGRPPILTASGMVLLQGYVNSISVLSYPTSPLETVFEGRGAQLTYPVTVAAGAEWTLTVPPLTLWRIVGASFSLNTSAAPGNRTVVISAKDAAGGQFAFWASGFPQTPGTGIAYGFSASGTSVQTAITINIAFANDLFLPAGYSIGTVTFGLQPGDQYTGIAVGIEAWMGY